MITLVILHSELSNTSGEFFHLLAHSTIVLSGLEFGVKQNLLLCNTPEVPNNCSRAPPIGMTFRTAAAWTATFQLSGYNWCQ